MPGDGSCDLVNDCQLKQKVPGARPALGLLVTVVPHASVRAHVRPPQFQVSSISSREIYSCTSCQHLHRRKIVCGDKSLCSFSLRSA